MRHLRFYEFLVFLPILLVFVFFSRKDYVEKQQAINSFNTQSIGFITQQESSSSISFNIQTLLLPDVKIASKELTDLFDGTKSCTFETKHASGEAYIQNGKGALQLKDKVNTNIIIKDNCVYVWAKNAKEGSKICDIAKFYSLSKTIQTIPKELGSMLGENVTYVTDIQEGIVALKECQQAKTIDTKKFILPKTITFKEEVLQLPF